MKSQRLRAREKERDRGDREKERLRHREKARLRDRELRNHRPLYLSASLKDSDPLHGHTAKLWRV